MVYVWTPRIVVPEQSPMLTAVHHPACWCGPCEKAQPAPPKPIKPPRIPKPRPRLATHGDNSYYIKYKCRCDLCKAGAAAYRQTRKSA